MSGSERRVIKSMAFGGLTVIVLGLLVVAMGWSQWWFEKTHLLGSFGIEMLVYACWHAYFYHTDV